MTLYRYSKKFYRKPRRKAELLAMWRNVWTNRYYIWKPFILIMVMEGLQMLARIQIAELVRLIELADSVKLGLLIGGIVLIDFVGLWAEIWMWRIINRDIHYKMSQEQKFKLISHVSRLGYLFFANTPSSQVQDRINRSQYLPDLIVEGLRVVVGNLFQTGLSMLIMLFYSPVLALVAICAFVMIIRTDRLMRRQRRIVKSVRRDVEEGSYDTEVTVTSTNQMLHDNGAMPAVLKRIRHNNKLMQRLAELETEMGLRGVGIWRDWGVSLGRRSILALAIVLTIGGEFSPADFMLVYTLAETTFIGVWGLMHYMDDLQRFSPIAEDVEELLSVLPTIQEPLSPVPLPNIPVPVSLRDVTYAYDSDVAYLRPDEEAQSYPGEESLKKNGAKLRQKLGLPPVQTGQPKQVGDLGYLHEITFCIAPGEKVALVGASGSGKTTIANLIRKALVADSGEILFGGTNIRDVSSIDIHHYVGVVQQNVDILPTTLRDNITLGDSFSDEEVIAAIKAAMLWEDPVSLWPELIYQRIGDRGATISGGQQQRVALARLFLRKPWLVILDEATSAQDTVTEGLIQASIDSLLKGRSALIIAHRLSTVRKVDKIVVLERGQVVEVGSWSQLYENPQGIFRSLVDAQKLE